MTIRQIGAILGLLSLLCSGCNRHSSRSAALGPNTPILKIAVSADGRLTVDGAASTIESLQVALTALSEKQGAVWYYRETGQQEQPPIAMDVMKSVVKARLPIRLSSRPDYSDAIGFDGKPLMK